MRKLLYFRWQSYMNVGIDHALEKLHIDYDVFEWIMKEWENDPKLEELLTEKVRSGTYDTLFSVNYSPILSRVCMRMGLRYVAWSYDSPMNIRDLESMKNSCNEIYLFDRGQVEEYRKLGIPMHHMPLAVDTDAFALQITLKDIAQFTSDVSLVGKLYQTEYAPYIAPLSEYTKGYLEGIISAQSKVFGACLIPELATDDILSKINADYKQRNIPVQMERAELEYLLCSEVTHRERLLILSLLAKHFDTRLYTSDSDIQIPNLKVHGYVNYFTVMPKIMALSKINLCPTLKAIRTGMPLRSVDILGCKGFLLTSVQEELFEYCNPGEDCETYASIEELYQKATFYIAHDDIRQQIANNGFENAKKNFTFEDRLRKLLL